ncbi:MAG: tail fiber protein [Proteobacteria bacterium]|nr:tail fiber protein [Pseudomonadota bacterium]
MYKLKFIILSLGCLLLAPKVYAQTCATAPSCAALGYTQTAAECSGKAMVKCPFDNAQVFCGVSKSCNDLGYTMTAAQCTGRKTIPCPYDTTKVVCDASNMVGEIRLWPSATAPKGWKICDGSSLLKTSYSALFSVIGTTYGGSGNYFYLPNLKGRVPVGVGYVYGGTSYTYTLGETGGQNFVQLTSDQIPDHKHIMAWGEANGDGATWGTSGSGAQGSNKTDWDNYRYMTSYMYSRSGYRSAPSSSTSGWGSAGSCDSYRTYGCSTSYHENRPPYLVLNYIIYTGVY